MNTQTHLLVAAAALARPGRPWRNAAVLAGALLPDVSIFVLFGWSKLAGVPELKVWGELYWSDGWQLVSAISNSFILWGVAALAAFVALRRARGALRVVAGLGLAMALAGLTHLAFDIPVHADDAHRHFWPLTDWRFHSPLSYWNDAQYGRWVSLAEMALGLTLIVLLWRRFGGWIARVALGLAAASYLLVPLYWALSLGGA